MAAAQGHVFISYSHDQRELAHRVADELRQHGADTLLADELHAGSDLQGWMRDALDHAKAVVVVVGTERSAWNRFELSEVLKRAWADDDVFILPVLVGDADPPGYLRDLHALHVDSDGRGIERVVATLEHPPKRGLMRTNEGDKRLDDRLAQIEQAAAEAEATADDG